MKLTYTLTLDDYRASLRLHKRQNLGRRIHFFIYDVLFPSFAVVAIMGTIGAYAFGQPDLVDDLLVPDVALVTISVFVQLLRSYRIRKLYKQLFPPGRIDRNWSIEMDDERILSTVPGVGEGKYFWTGIQAFAQNEKITMLYITESQYLAVPTCALSEEQRTELNDLVARNMPRKQK